MGETKDRSTRSSRETTKYGKLIVSFVRGAKSAMYDFLALYFSDVSREWLCTLQLLARIGEETLDTPVFVQVEGGRCHVMTECLMRYALIGQPASATGCGAVKLLQVAVFAPVALSAAAAAHLYNLRVYFVDDTADAFEV